MKPMLSLFPGVFIALFFYSCGPNKTEFASQELHKIFEEYREYCMISYPTWATYEGDHRYNNRLTDGSHAAVLERLDSMSNMVIRLEKIDPSLLNEADRLNRDLFREMILKDQSGREFNLHFMPLTQQSGLHLSFPQMPQYMPFKTMKDWENYLARLRGFSKAVDDLIENMTYGMDSDMMPPRFVVEQIIEQINNLLQTPVEQSSFLRPIELFEDELEPKKESFKEELIAHLDEAIWPPYRKLLQFLTGEYIERARNQDGIWSIGNGEMIYTYLVEHHTTLSLSPDEIFAIGMSEVERITDEMKALKDQIGFQGDLQEFFNHLRTAPEFYYTDKEELMEEYRRILERMDAQLPDLFGRLPRAPYELKEIEEFRAKSAPQAYYYSAPEDGSRPGYFYVNTYNLPARPKYTMTALALHEAVPGHHLQIAIAKELESLPWFRKNYSSTAYVEGWGLYAESLGYETGMYEDLYQRFGALTFEIWRACRLVVDVGIHHKQWTREQGVEFMLKHTPNSEHDVRSEVDRYIAWPGQALAYKIGELRIKNLRQQAERELGNRFDIRAFHDLILENGPLPMPLLENNVKNWVAAIKNSAS